MSNFCPGYKIGLTTATLKPVTWYGVPFPNRHGYQAVAILRQTGGMDVNGYGFPSASWSWRSLSQTQLYSLLDLFARDTDMSVNVYIDTYKNVGYDAELATFLCKMIRPVGDNGKAIVPQSANMWTNVTIQFTHLEEQ